MAIKKEMKAWAIKLRGRSFYQNLDGMPFVYHTKSAASIIALRVRSINSTPAEPIRVKIKVEEV